MSMSLEQVINEAGYDIDTSVEDATWLLSQVNKFEELVVRAEDFIEEQDV